MISHFGIVDFSLLINFVAFSSNIFLDSFIDRHRILELAEMPEILLYDSIISMLFSKLLVWGINEIIEFL